MAKYVQNGATRSTSGIGKLVYDLPCRDAVKMYFDMLKKGHREFLRLFAGAGQEVPVGDGMRGVVAITAKIARICGGSQP